MLLVLFLGNPFFDSCWMCTRRAFEDAQKACKAAEEACRAARAEATRLKEELAQAQAQLQAPADVEAEPARQQGPKVKRMIAQLEVRSISAWKPSRYWSPPRIYNAPDGCVCEWIASSLNASLAVHAPSPP